MQRKPGQAPRIEYRPNNMATSSANSEDEYFDPTLSKGLSVHAIAIRGEVRTRARVLDAQALMSLS